MVAGAIGHIAVRTLGTRYGDAISAIASLFAPYKKNGQTRCGSSTLENEKASIQFFVHAIAGRQIVDEGLCFVLI
jgi:hypothetical protein